MRFFLLCLVLWWGSSVARAQAPVAAPPPVAPADTATKKKVAPMPDTPWVPEYGGTGTVMRRDNTDIYIMSKPLRPYEVTGRLVNDSMAAETDPDSGLIVLRGQTILEQIDALLTLGRRRQTYYDFPYDALLTVDGQVGTFVRWKNRKPSQAATPTEQRTEQP